MTQIDPWQAIRDPFRGRRVACGKRAQEDQVRIVVAFDELLEHFERVWAVASPSLDK
jgi:hypothetical protein